MKTILETIRQKPSSAIRAMIDGLKKQSQREGFEVCMGTYGEYRTGICFACAATCALQELAGVDFTDDMISTVGSRAAVTGFDPVELRKFELAMNQVRFGNMCDLFSFCGLPFPNTVKYNKWFAIYNSTWREKLPGAEELITSLQKNGY